MEDRLWGRAGPAAARTSLCCGVVGLVGVMPAGILIPVVPHAAGASGDGAGASPWCCRPLWRGLSWRWLISRSIAREILQRAPSAGALDYSRSSYLGPGLQACEEPASRQDTRGQPINPVPYVFRLHGIGEAALVLISSTLWHLFCPLFPRQVRHGSSARE